MKHSVCIKNSKIVELLQSNCIAPQYKYMIGANPYIENDDYLGRIEGYVDDVMAGAVFTFPIQFVYNGEVVDALSGSNFYVDKEYRKYELGMMIPEEMIARSENIILGGVSQEAQPVYEYYDYHFFDMPRDIYIVNPHFFVNTMFHGVTARCLSFVGKICCGLLYDVFRVIRKTQYMKYKVVLAKNSEDYVNADKIICQDGHPFRENHDIRWLKWVMGYKDGHPESNQRLYYVYRDKDLVGFFIIKNKFRELLNGKYKNVVYGSLLEWGTIDENILSEQDICALAFIKFGKSVDAMSFASVNPDMTKRIPKILKRRKGKLNMAVRLDSNIYSDFADISHWRVRPAAGDASF